MGWGEAAHRPRKGELSTGQGESGRDRRLRLAPALGPPASRARAGVAVAMPLCRRGAPSHLHRIVVGEVQQYARERDERVQPAAAPRQCRQVAPPPPAAAALAAALPGVGRPVDGDARKEDGKWDERAEAAQHKFVVPMDWRRMAHSPYVRRTIRVHGAQRERGARAWRIGRNRAKAACPAPAAPYHGVDDLSALRQPAVRGDAREHGEPPHEQRPHGEHLEGRRRLEPQRVLPRPAARQRRRLRRGRRCCDGGGGGRGRGRRGGGGSAARHAAQGGGGWGGRG
jgi:hypothetical protein